MARPQKDPEAMNRAIRLVAGGLSAEDASAAIGGKLAPSTIANEAARRRKARPAALGPSSAIVLTQGQPAPAARPVSLSALLEEPAAAPPPEPLPADRLERAETLRRVIAAGDMGADTIDRLALTWGCTAAEVRQVMIDAGTLAPDKLPESLALQESIAFGLRVRKKAEEAADWKSALAAQVHLDGLRGVKKGAAPTAPPGAGHVARSEVIATLRRAFAALAPWPEAQAAFRAAVQG